MNRFEILTLILMAYLLICLQVVFNGWIIWIHGYIWFPALAIAYAISRSSIEAALVICVVAGLWIDSLSLNRFGISIIAFVLSALLADRAWKNWSGDSYLGVFAPGCIVGSFFPIFSIIILLVAGEQPQMGWRFYISIPISGLIIGLLLPLFKNVMDFIMQTLQFKPVIDQRYKGRRENLS